MVAPALIGRVLVSEIGGTRVAGRIVESEAYQEDDPASHSFGGPRGRNVVMFGPPGHLYVYLSYGLHLCMNVVTGGDGEGSAVLLRAVEPLEGLETMRRRRGTDLGQERLLCAGPGRLAQAFGVARGTDGLDLVAGAGIWLERGRRVRRDDVGAGPRIGIAKAVDQPWRFFEAGSPFVSRGGRRPAPSATAISPVETLAEQALTAARSPPRPR